MVNERYYTWVNLTAIFLSLGVYFMYVWISNYLSFSMTYMTISMTFSTGLYFLTVIVCAFFCYVIDIFIASFSFEIIKQPVDFLKKILSNKRKKIETFDEEFQKIYGKIKTRYVGEDIEREVKIEEKRDLKVNKYGPNKFKDFKKKNEKKGPKNEIELEFLAQDEKDQYYREKYNKNSDEEESSIKEGYISPNVILR